jgi:hypothetical protein
MQVFRHYHELTQNEPPMEEMSKDLLHHKVRKK